MKFWNKDFSMIATGQTISLFANNILHFALSLYVLDLTNSGTAFGGRTAISMIPTILFMPFVSIEEILCWLWICLQVLFC